MFRRLNLLPVSLILIPASLLSAPLITVDSPTFNCGVIQESKADKLKASFVLRNTGDEVLKIQNVRPGCGCTVVKFDSIVPPGKSISIDADVNIKGYRSGPVSKGMTVTSNAQNTPQLRLTIEATVQSPVDVSTSYLHLFDTLTQTVYLTSDKKDLAIKSVRFESPNPSGPAWQQKLPTSVKYSVSRLDSVSADGRRVYRLEITPPQSSNASDGEFLLSTNHPEKAEIAIRGRVGR